jgi:glyoxylase-like metal-dependent hydrolase (beta-lactamase superfamily II)
MKAIGATVMSSGGSRDNMVRGNQPGLPQITYSGNSRFFFGGKEIQLMETRGHTRGDTIVYLPQSKVLIAGDLVETPDAIPTIVNYADGGNWTDLAGALNRMARFDFDVMVAGHGPLLTKAQYLAYRDRTEAIRERFRALNRERKSAEEIGQIMTREMNWGTGPAAGNIAGMMQELR